MALVDLLVKRKQAILDGWMERVIDSYPEQAGTRMKRMKDPFQNPVGSNLRLGLEMILDGVLAGAAANDLAEGLDKVARIRAIQDFSPSEAIGFLLDLKAIFREHAGKDGASDEFAALDTAVDRMTLSGFDQYMVCREKLSEIRINEIRNQSHLALRQFGILGREPDPGLPFTAGCDTERGPQT